MNMLMENKKTEYKKIEYIRLKTAIPVQEAMLKGSTNEYERRSLQLSISKDRDRFKKLKASLGE
jgi:hypothetical protein